ncbi:MAG: hypothetical protein R3321_02410 [Nitrososphaeraceae archaeon]|nr:hypothetical protein [Nitrososphaeraceae archaeon]
MAKRKKGRKKAALYKEENYNNTHTEFIWFDKKSNPIYYRETALYDNRYLEFFHPYHLMNALNCRQKV